MGSTPTVGTMEFKDLNLLSIGDTIQMVGAIYEGEGKTLLVFFPGEHNQHSVLQTVFGMGLPEWQAFLRQTDLLETEILTKAKDGTLVKAIARKSQRQIDQHVSWKVFKRDGYRCRYCANDDVPLTVDHLVRWEEGGPSIEANLVASCRQCNKIRGNHSYEDWLGHPAYRDRSRKLTPEVRALNEAVAGTLASIPRVVHVRSR